MNVDRKISLTILFPLFLAASATHAQTLTSINVNGDTASSTPSEPIYWKPIGTDTPVLIQLYDDLTAARSPGASAKLSTKYGMSTPQLNQLLLFLKAMERDVYGPREKGTVRTALTLPDRAGRAPVVIANAAAALGSVEDHECDRSDIDALMEGSTDIDRDLWLIGLSCQSVSSFVELLKTANGPKIAMLWNAALWSSWAKPQDDQTVYDVLLSPAIVDHIDPASRPRLQSYVIGRKLSQLYAMGLIDEALAFADSLPPELLHLALFPSKNDALVKIDGFEFVDSGDSYLAHLSVDHAAALAARGRAAEAETLLGEVASPSARQAARKCLDSMEGECLPSNGPVTTNVLIVDQYLRDPKADPYMLLEYQIGDVSGSSGPVDELLCRMLTESDDQRACRLARAAMQGALKGEDEKDDISQRRLLDIIMADHGDIFHQRLDHYATLIAKNITPATPDEIATSRPSTDPAPVPFRELPLPANTRGPRPKVIAIPKSMTELPQGFEPVRFERQGNRVAIISISPMFDPNGEIGAGGYWVHLSNDGGRSWDDPLYTGLAERFPYVVLSTSRLPMLSADQINLEVAERLLDTASITYPPVGMTIRRKRDGIYLQIPIADLKRDSDGDGISDIAARHLLLDQPDGPFVVGRDSGCATPPSSETLARLEILKKLYRVEASAIIESVDRPKAQIFGGWTRKRGSMANPIFLEGDPADYRCVTLDRPMFVYRKADRERLRKYSPDFQLVSLPAITWNRAHTRGFVNWSMGWTGGTYRLTKVGTVWKLDSISEWIT